MSESSDAHLSVDELRDMVGSGRLWSQSSWNPTILVKAEGSFNSNGGHSFSPIVLLTSSGQSLLISLV